MINKVSAAVVTALLAMIAFAAVRYGGVDPNQLLYGAFFAMLYMTYRDASRIDDLEKRLGIK